MWYNKLVFLRDLRFTPGLSREVWMSRSLSVIFSFALLSLFSAGCGDLGVGDACEVAECDVQDPPDNANTVCEPAVQCRTLLCVGQGQGLGTGNIDQFCSVDCDVDDDCPEGFACAVVAEVGSNAGRKLCLK
jgi:hypothetical protein